MLSMQEVQDELAQIEYRSGWTFTAYEGLWEGHHIVIRTTVPDSYNPGETVVLDIHSMLPPMPDRAYLRLWVAWRCARIEVHEMREFLRRDGKPIFDPHAPGADHDVR